jgi:hypothetical protein
MSDSGAIHTPKKALQQTIYGKRATGKPGKRWEDAVQEDSIKLLGTKAWKTKAKDRQFWRQCIEEAKAQYGLKHHKRSCAIHFTST